MSRANQRRMCQPRIRHRTGKVRQWRPTPLPLSHAATDVPAYCCPRCHKCNPFPVWFSRGVRRSWPSHFVIETRLSYCVSEHRVGTILYIRLLVGRPPRAEASAGPLLGVVPIGSAFSVSLNFVVSIESGPAGLNSYLIIVVSIHV